MEKTPVCAIICELNPLHTGHERLFRFAKQGGAALVCVLSGNFVQRGEPALFDKWTRAEAALRCGADLVVELPLPWAMAGAQNFAAGAVALATAAGAQSLVFGSECGDTAPLLRLAEYLLSPAFSRDLHGAPAQEQRLPFAQRRACAAARALGEADAALLNEPNNNLAVAYCMAIREQNAPLTPRTLLRTGAAHDAPAAADAASSHALRSMLLANDPTAFQYIPEPAAELFRACPMATAERLTGPLLYRLRTATAADFADLPDVSEGLENRFLRAAKTACNLEHLYALVKTKRYSHARIRRTAMALLLGLRGRPGLPPYLRVLGMTSRGASLLQSANLPVLTRVAQLRAMSAACRMLFALESRADDIYALALPEPGPCGVNSTHALLKYP